MRAVIHGAVISIIIGLFATLNADINALLRDKIPVLGFDLGDPTYDKVAKILPFAALTFYIVFLCVPFLHQRWKKFKEEKNFDAFFQSPLVMTWGKSKVKDSFHANKTAPIVFSDDEKFLLVLLVKARDQHVIMGESHLKFALKTIFKMSDASINLLIKRSDSKNFIIHHNIMAGDDYFSANEYYYTQIQDKDNEFIWHEILPDDLKGFDNNNPLI